MNNCMAWLVMLASVMMCGCKGDAKDDAAAGDRSKQQIGKSGPATQPAPRKMPPAIRIDAGSDKPWTDPQGNVWAAETGFEGGGSVDRGPIEIVGTDKPDIYRTERYGMESFSVATANGKYTVKLHFAETFSGVSGPGERVFGVKVEDKDLGKVDVFKEAGAANKALVKSVEVNVMDGKLDIVFTADTQNPEINAIEIIPAG